MESVPVKNVYNKNIRVNIPGILWTFRGLSYVAPVIDAWKISHFG